jgi:TonB family protein
MKFTTVLLMAAAGFAALSSAQAQVSWPYEYMRGEYVVPCLDKEEDSCVWHRLIVDNGSTDTLECYGQMNYSGNNRQGKSTVEHKFVVEPNTRRAVVGDATATDIHVTTHKVECVIRRPYDDSKLTPQCSATWTKKPTETIDYPPESRAAGEEGPVLLELTLSDKEGPPTDVKVVGSSLWPKLDASAAKYVGQYAGTTNCKQGRFRMPLTFRLR